MLEDEVIPPSDPEEEEEFRANQTGYWEAVAAAIRQLGNESEFMDSEFGSRSPPRKRVKRTHSVKSEPLNTGHHEEIMCNVQSSPAQLPLRKRSLSPLNSQDRPSASIARASLSNISNNAEPSMTQTLLTPSPAPSFIDLTQGVSVPVPSPRESKSATYTPLHHISTVEANQSLNENERKLPASRPLSRLESATVSLNTPPASQGVHEVTDGTQIVESIDKVLSLSRSPSPLTPIASPERPAIFHSHPQSLISESQILVPNSPRSRIDASELWRMAENEARPYALRQRTRRQEHPYLYDYALYKRQLEAYPEAVDPKSARLYARSARRSRSPMQSHSSDVEYTEETRSESDEELARSRRRSKSASTGRSPPRQRLQELPPPPPVASSSRWLPRALQEDFTDSDDDEPLVLPVTKPTPRNGDDESGPSNKQHRRKRFPMLKRRDQRTSVSRSPSPQLASSRSFLRTTSHRRIQSDDEDGPMAGPSRLPDYSPSRPEDDPWDSEFPSADDLPTSARASSDSMDIELTDPRASPDPDPSDDAAILNEIHENDFLAEEDNGLSPHLRQDVHDLARHWPQGDILRKDEEEGTLSNPIAIPDEENETESDDEPDLRQRRGHKVDMKALRRMYPAVHILKQMGVDRKGKRVARNRLLSEEAEDGPVRAGQVRVRRRSIPLRNDEIRGDEESSEDENTGRGSVPLDIVIPFHSPRRSITPNLPTPTLSDVAWNETGGAVRVPEVVEVSSSSSSESDDDGVHDAVDDRARATWNGEGICLKNEANLVDYMLNRTGVKRRKKREKSSKGSSRHKPHTSMRQPRMSATTTRVVSRDVRTLGRERQTLLPVSQMRASQGSTTHYAAEGHREAPSGSAVTRSTSPPAIRDAEPRRHFVVDVTVGQNNSKQQDRKKGSNIPGVYTFAGQKQISTGRVHPQAYTVQAEIERGDPSEGRLYIYPPSHSPSSPKRKQQSRTFSAPVKLRNPRLEEFGFEIQETTPFTKDASRHSTPQQDEVFEIEEPPSHAVSWPTAKEQLDCKAPKLSSGKTLAPQTGLADGRLQELLSSSAPSSEEPPPPAHFNQAALNSEMPLASFVDILETGFTDLLSSLSRDTAQISAHDYDDWCRSLQNTGPYVTWFRHRCSPEGLNALKNVVNTVLKLTYQVVEEFYALRADDEFANRLVLEIQWHSIELAYRVSPESHIDLLGRTATNLGTHLKLLINHLLAFDSARLPLTIWFAAGCPKPYRRVAELWISLVHLTQNWKAVRQVGSLWSILQQTIKESDMYKSKDYWYIASERTWETIFSLCVWSQFSAFGISTSRSRLPAAWGVVDLTLKLVDFRERPDLRKRRRKTLDGYLRLLIGRCLFLHQIWEWNWTTQEALAFFSHLVVMFKARQFANMMDEKADFPKFMRQNNLELLKEQAGNAYTLFLKLLIAAASNADHSLAKKLLSLVGPVGGLSFKEASSSLQQFSGLCNRLTFIAVAIYLNPSDCKNAISRARRYVETKDMDHLTCRGCVRGAMFIGQLMKKKDLPMQDLVDWLTEITEELVGQFITQEYPGRVNSNSELGSKGDKLMISIQMVLRAIRRIMEADPADKSQYPDPALLAERCIDRICVPDARLTSCNIMAKEMQDFILFFLDMRNKPLPARLASVGQEESQEDYGLPAMDWDDPAVLAALGGDDDACKRQDRDEDVVNRIYERLIPVLYRLVCQGIRESDPEVPSKDVILFGWVQCWVSCASVVVRGRRKPWSFYIQLAEFAWNDAHPALQRKLKLRFRYTTLQYDPSTYETEKLEYLRAMLQCMVVPKMTLSSDYVSQVLWNDGLKHPLFFRMPREFEGRLEPLQILQEEYEAQRLSLLERIIANVGVSVDRQAGGDQSVSANNEQYIELMSSMLTTMRGVFSELIGDMKSEYAVFCQHVFDALSQTVALRDHSALQDLVSWLNIVATQAMS